MKRWKEWRDGVEKLEAEEEQRSGRSEVESTTLELSPSEALLGEEPR